MVIAAVERINARRRRVHGQRMDTTSLGSRRPNRRALAIHRPGDALLVVDVQRDFLPGGALAVPGGDAVLAPLNEALALCASRCVLPRSPRPSRGIEHEG